MLMSRNFPRQLQCWRVLTRPSQDFSHHHSEYSEGSVMWGPSAGVAILSRISLVPWFSKREVFGVLGVGEVGPSRLKQSLAEAVMSVHLLSMERPTMKRNMAMAKGSRWQLLEGQAVSPPSLLRGLNSGGPFTRA
uniref:Uncharacterized protein MANES_05G021600 n=1 Tax=Rhizophora mucronata TaxID=61149 RepID=A0A2P2IS24_RHIMU